jgi:hypothetical protein
VEEIRVTSEASSGLMSIEPVSRLALATPKTYFACGSRHHHVRYSFDLLDLSKNFAIRYVYGEMPPLKKVLKKLSVVDPRTVWQGEATEFTPWFAAPGSRSK